MTMGLPSDNAGRLIVNMRERLLVLAASMSCIGVGPGLGKSSELVDLMSGLYSEIEKPMVVDADALNALAEYVFELLQPGGPRIVTPHPGEFMRLLGEEFEGAKLSFDEMRKQAVRMAKRGKAVVVLKGHKTFVTDGNRYFVNPTGNPGMATAGSGDVLTGILTALVGQSLPVFDAACIGVYLHGMSGDLAAKSVGQISLIATDIIDHLPAAFQQYPQKPSRPSDESP
jgi:ADP-dependent NAD(P)H-hydrate dehydratase